jgi:HD-like signal output (HDOD) protein
MQSPTAGLDDVSAIVLRDQGLAAKVLQLVNSAYFGARQKTSSIQQAVSLLGIDRLRYIALTASIFTAGDGDLKELQELSTRTAQLASGFLGTRSGEGFAAALMCDVGRIIFMLGMKDAYREVVAAAPPGQLAAAEEQAFGATHADVGARLLSLWGLPSPIIEMVRYHHKPDLAPEPVRILTGAIYVADALAHGVDPATFDQSMLTRAGVLHLLPAWCAIARAS